MVVTIYNSFKSRLYASVFAVSCGIALSVFLSGCGSSVEIPEVPSKDHLPSFAPSEIQLTPAQERTMGLTLDRVREETLDNILQTSGQVQAMTNQQSHSYSPVTGLVMDVPFSVGQHVHEGQMLARIKSDQIGQLQTDLLQQILQTDSDRKQAQVQVKLSQTIYNRESRLYLEKVSPRADVEAAQAQLQKDQAMIQALDNKRQSLIASYQARLSLYGAAPDSAQRVVREKKISPFITLMATRSGVLIDRNINPGELVDPTKLLFTTADLSKVWLVGEIYEKDIRRVHLGMPVDVQLDSLPNETFRGKVSFMDAILDPSTRTLEIRSEVQNPHLLLKPNMFARVALVSNSRQGLAVSRQAVQQNGDYNFVYLPLGNHRYLEQKVLLGNSSGPMVEVLAGVKAGTEVVTQGSLALKGEVLKQQVKGKE